MELSVIFNVTIELSQKISFSVIEANIHTVELLVPILYIDLLISSFVKALFHTFTVCKLQVKSYIFTLSFKASL